MNDLETKHVPAPETEALKQQCAALQRQVTTLLVGLFIVSGTLSVFLWRQARYARADLEAVKGPAAQLIQGFKQEKAAMDAFVGNLAEFGRTHPDFIPILNKYRIPLSTGAPPVVPAPNAAPAPAPKK